MKKEVLSEARPQKDTISFAGMKPVSNVLFGGLLLFFLFEYVRPGYYFPILQAAKIGTLIPLAVFVATLFSNRGSSHHSVISAPNTIWFLFFFLLIFIQLFTADVSLYVFNIFKTVFGYFLIYFIMVRQVTDIQRVKSIFFILLLAHLLMILLNPAVVLQPETRNYIVGGTFLGDGNDYAWSLCIVLPFSLFLAQSSKTWVKKIVFYGLFILFVLAIIGSQSRGASIALGALLVYLVSQGHRRILGFIGIAVLVSLILAFAPQSYFDRMKTLKEYQTEGSAQGRIMAWKAGVRMAVDHPFIGVGAGHFGVKYGVEYRPKGVGRTEIPWSNAHSIYFVALGEFGFSGIAFLIGLLAFNFKRNREFINKLKERKLVKDEMFEKLFIVLQASMIGYAVGGAFLSGLYYPHLFVLAALMESARLLVLGTKSKNNSKTIT